MTIPRIYSPEPLANIKTCELGPDNFKYLKQVMRLNPGDRIYIFDGQGREFEAVIQEYRVKNVLVGLGKMIPAAEKKIRITLAQALPKAKKMDTIVKTAAELGTDMIIPFDAARSISHIAGEKSDMKMARWQKIAKEAARSSHSSHITEISKILSFEDMLSSAAQNSIQLIFWEEESRQTIRDVLTDASLADKKDFFVIVGPEGGFSKEEIAKAKEAGCIPVSLGRQILKVETAAAVIISIVQYEKGIFGKKSQEVEK